MLSLTFVIRRMKLPSTEVGKLQLEQVSGVGGIRETVRQSESEMSVYPNEKVK